MLLCFSVSTKMLLDLFQFLQGHYLVCFSFYKDVSSYLVCFSFYQDSIGEKDVETKPEYTEETGKVETVTTLSEMFREDRNPRAQEPREHCEK